MVLKTATIALLEQLAAENRRVLSDWRAVLLLRRATFTTPASERRWSQLPQTPEDMHPLLRQMQQRGEITPISRLRHIYEVTVPYARMGMISEEEILMEVNPYAALSHVTAMVFHAVTEDFPKWMTVTVPADGRGDMLPPGTDATDWEGISLPQGRMPTRILSPTAHWMRVKQERLFGINLFRQREIPIRVTTLERTLLDGLLHPELCVGIQSVLRAWGKARDFIDLEALVHYVERFDVEILRQRVGFILDELGLTHPQVDAWQARARRGGSSKLHGSAPYAPTYNERWSLSINAPISALEEGAW